MSSLLPIDDWSPEESAQTMGMKRPWGAFNCLEYGDGQGNHVAGSDLIAAPGEVSALDARVDAMEEELGLTIRYDANGDLVFPAGMIMKVDVPGTGQKDVLATDANGDIILGEADEQVNIAASQRPTVSVGGGTSQVIATMDDFADYVTEAAMDAELAYKADLVGGIVKAEQLPPGVNPNNFTVATEADLITLTTAIPNDRAKVTATDEIWLLWEAPPTAAANWENITALGGVDSVAGKTGNVTLTPGDITGLSSTLDDKANAADLAAYAPLASPTLTGSPKAPTPAANASGQEIMTAAAVNAKLTANLGSANPNMDGTAAAGSAATVSRSDHTHPTDTSRAPLASPTFTGAPSGPTAVAGTNTTQLATTAFVQTAGGNYQPKVTYSTTDLTAGSSSLATGQIYLVYE